MKTLIAVALVATSFPVMASSAVARSDNASGDRRVCTQVTIRAGSRMSGRRICRTAAEWREALGPDWRQHLAGYDGLQDQYDSMMARTSPDGETHGIQPLAGGLGVHPNGGPH